MLGRPSIRIVRWYIKALIENTVCQLVIWPIVQMVGRSLGNCQRTLVKDKDNHVGQVKC